MLERASMQPSARVPPSRCPHCGAEAIVERHSGLGFRCAVCGGPRLTLESQLASSERFEQRLRSAGKAHTRHLMFTAAGLVLLGLGSLALLVATLVVLTATPGALAALLALIACSVPIACGLWALGRAAAARRERATALHDARLAALAEAEPALGPLDATRAAELLQIGVDEAELLLAEVSVAALLEPPAPRRRIAGEPERPQETAGETEQANAPAVEPQTTELRR